MGSFAAASSDNSGAAVTSSQASSSAAAAASASASASSSLASVISSSIASKVSSSILSQAASTVTVEPSSTNVVTSTVSASSQAPFTTNIITSVVTQSATSNGITNTNPVTVVVTSVNSPASTAVATIPPASTTSSPAASSSAATALSNGGGSDSGTSGTSGLSTAGKTAIAVVIPVVFVALLVAFGIWFWRKRKQRRDDNEQRRKEIDEYGYNPNNDPTLPAIASESAGGTQMTEDGHGGYRGWGVAVGSNRKASTTLSGGGHTQGQLSESGMSYGPGGAPSPSGTGPGSDGHSSDPLVHGRQRDTFGSDELGALGAGPAAGAGAAAYGVRRGPSNASSAYSAGGRSDLSDEPVPPLPVDRGHYDMAPSGGPYGYSQHGPYGDGSYGGGQDAVDAAAAGMPIVRDVSARRHTRIQQAGGYQQGNSGIAQNF